MELAQKNTLANYSEKSGKINQEALNKYHSIIMNRGLLNLTIELEDDTFYFFNRKQNEVRFDSGNIKAYAQIQSKVRSGQKGVLVESISEQENSSVSTLKLEEKRMEKISEIFEGDNDFGDGYSEEEQNEILASIVKDGVIKVDGYTNIAIEEAGKEREQAESIDLAETTTEIAANLAPEEDDKEEIIEFRKRLISVLDKAKKAFDNVNA